LQQVSEPFQQETGIKIALSSGSTGILYSQIIHGAPYALFFSADNSTPQKLASGEGAPTVGAPFCYARGELVLVGGDGSLEQLADPTLSLAIANPLTAPYGEAARSVIARPEFSAGSARKLVRGNNVAQAYQFWHSGAVDLALVPRALAPDGAAVPGNWHMPLDQFAVALAPAASDPRLSRYLEWIRSDRVRTLITDAGYLPCP
jgi:molybdate transport system substrate-binding protein